MKGIHKTCYWHYVYGDEYEACAACHQRLLDAEELFCFGAYTEDAKPSPLQYWPYSCCAGRCALSCHCPDLWAEIFRRAQGDDDGVCRLLPENTTPAEFGCLYHEGYIHAYRITNDDADAHDAVQNAFFKIHRRPESPRHLRALFHRAVHNAALDIVRNRKRFVPIDEQRIPDHDECRDAIVAAEDAMSLSEAMAGLPSGDRQILHMHYIEGLSRAEIAKRLGVPITTVDQRLYAARRRLKKALLEHGIEELAAQ